MVTSDLGACEWFVWDLRRSGLIDRGPLDQLVGEFLRRNPRAEAPELAEFLVEQGTLTTFQAERILNGKSQGLVLGPYVLLDAIGSGSMGQVYRASTKNDNCLYAVKVLPRRSMWNVRLARRQVRTFGNFSHPAVVPFVDVGTTGGLHYLAWPLAEGQTLEALVEEKGKLQHNLAALFVVQVAQGLNIAHQNNLFHGLIKPSNILVGHDNQARILDFGIGSLLVENEGESLVDTMSTANTLTSGLDCASPESIMEPTTRTLAGDQYSLGCVLYFCLTGRVPFPEGSAVEKMIAHQTKEPVSIRELAPDVPEGLEAIVKRLMAKTPEKRFGGCDELVEALEPFLGELSQLANNSANTLSGSRPGLKGLSSSSRPGLPPRSNPGSKITLPNRTAPVPPNVRTPEPQPGRSPASVPNRASFLPAPTAENGQDSSPAMPPLPADVRSSLPKLPTRATAADAGLPKAKAKSPAPQLEVVEDDETPAWAVENFEERKPVIGAVGLIATAMLLMVAAYMGATFLMK